MMRLRSFTAKPIQPAISAVVRPQPTHSPKTGSTAHILLQGVSISAHTGEIDVGSRAR